jgi:hypothetical protein
MPQPNRWMTPLDPGERVQVEVGDSSELYLVQFGEVADQVLSPIATTYDGNPEFVHGETLSPVEGYVEIEFSELGQVQKHLVDGRHFRFVIPDAMTSTQTVDQ